MTSKWVKKREPEMVLGVEDTSYETGRKVLQLKGNKRVVLEEGSHILGYLRAGMGVTIKKILFTERFVVQKGCGTLVKHSIEIDSICTNSLNCENNLAVICYGGVYDIELDNCLIDGRVINLEFVKGNYGKFNEGLA